MVVAAREDKYEAEKHVDEARAVAALDKEAAESMAKRAAVADARAILSAEEMDRQTQAANDARALKVPPYLIYRPI